MPRLAKPPGCLPHTDLQAQTVEPQTLELPLALQSLVELRMLLLYILCYKSVVPRPVRQLAVVSRHGHHLTQQSGGCELCPCPGSAVARWRLWHDMIIALKGAIRDCLQSPHCAANRLQHIRSSGPSPIVCKSRAMRTFFTCNMSCCVPCGTEGQLSHLSLTEFKSYYLTFILLAEPLTDEGGEETGVPGANPWRHASENATYSTKARRFKPQGRLEPTQ